MNNLPGKEKKNWEISDILDLGISDYKNQYNVPSSYEKVIKALTDCRTVKMGGHSYACDSCDYEKNAYNSCRNRHCPKCQGMARLKWVECRMEELLPVQYFHCVLTVPSELNPFALRHKEPFYTILQKAAAETLSELSQDPNHIGGKTGYISVLHTWGQNLLDHPHLHCIVPGGGLSEHKEWVSCKEDFLFPLKVVSRLFKGKFMAKFKESVKKGDIKFHGKLKEYADYSTWRQFINLLYEKEWVVYLKEPFGGPEQVLKYLGGYTHRIAIANHRILNVKDGSVYFSWKNNVAGGVRQVMKLSIVEFIRRFLLHVLPKGYKRIRYYGFLSNRTRKKALELCFKLLGKIKDAATATVKSKSVLEILKRLFGIDVTVCPKCGKGKLVPVFAHSGNSGGLT